MLETMWNNYVNFAMWLQQYVLIINIILIVGVGAYASFAISLYIRDWLNNRNP